ncbi:unnamed protein product [Urochloa humidicola]
MGEGKRGARRGGNREKKGAGAPSAREDTAGRGQRHRRPREEHDVVCDAEGDAAPFPVAVFYKLKPSPPNRELVVTPSAARTRGMHAAVNDVAPTPGLRATTT